MKRRKKKGQGLKHSRTEVMGETECGGENNAWLWPHPREATVWPGKKVDDEVAPKSLLLKLSSLFTKKVLDYFFPKVSHMNSASQLAFLCERSLVSLWILKLFTLELIIA